MSTWVMIGLMWLGASLGCGGLWVLASLGWSRRRRKMGMEPKLGGVSSVGSPVPPAISPLTMISATPTPKSAPLPTGGIGSISASSVSPGLVCLMVDDHVLVTLPKWG